jgi:putative ABC transport system permease protein
LPALVLGIAIRAAALLPSVHAVTGSARPYLPPVDWLTVLTGTVLLTGAAVALPARRALRGRAIEAAATRE